MQTEKPAHADGHASNDKTLTHVDENNLPRMVDVGPKSITHRTATATSTVRFPMSVADRFRDGELYTKKGPVFQTAIIAGTMAAKRTSDIIPFCHPLAVERCDISVRMSDDGVARIECTVALHGKTGVEMEALTGATVAALTVYDMCKSLSHDIIIEETRLVSKHGGKSDVDRR